jgi:hypothetical protein
MMPVPYGIGIELIESKPIKESDKRIASIKFILKYNMYHTVYHNVDTIRPYSRITFYHTT